MLDKTKGILISKIMLLITFILQVIEILVMLDILPPRGNLMKIVYAGIAASWLLAGRTVYHAVLPAHGLSGKTIAQTERGYDDHNLPVSYIVRQAPAERLRDFLISIGKHNYAIMEQAGQTYIVFYNGNGKNGNSSGLKDMLLKLFPGLVLERTGFDQLLGLPAISQVDNGMNRSGEVIMQQENPGADESSDNADNIATEIIPAVKNGRRKHGILALPFLVVMIHVVAFNTGLPVMIPLISSLLVTFAAMPPGKEEDTGTSLLEGNINHLMETDANIHLQNHDMEKLDSELKKAEKILAETPIENFSGDRLQQITRNQLDRNSRAVNHEGTVNDDTIGTSWLRHNPFR